MMRSIRARLGKLEADMSDDEVPLVIILDDDDFRVGGVSMTEEEYQTRYGEQVEQELAAGSRRILGIDFRTHSEGRHES